MLPPRPRQASDLRVSAEIHAFERVAWLPGRILGSARLARPMGCLDHATSGATAFPPSAGRSRVRTRSGCTSPADACGTRRCDRPWRATRPDRDPLFALCAYLTPCRRLPPRSTPSALAPRSTGRRCRRCGSHPDAVGGGACAARAWPVWRIANRTVAWPSPSTACSVTLPVTDLTVR